MNTKEKTGLILDVIYFGLIAAFIWVATTSMIQSFTCTRLTQSEVFMRIPQSFLLDFITC